MKQVWNGEFGRPVKVPDIFKIVITLDIPHIVVYDRDHPARGDYPWKEGLKEAEFEMQTLVGYYDNRDEMDRAYWDLYAELKQSRDNGGMIRFGRDAVMVNHIVSVNRVIE